MLKTILMAVVGFGLLWLALAAEIAAHECGGYLSTSLSRTAQENLCAEVSASITGEDVRVPRYSAVGTVEGTEPRFEAASPRVEDYRGIRSHVQDYRSVAGHPCPQDVPLDCEEAYFEAHYRARLEKDPCDLMARRWLKMAPCTAYERGIAAVEN